MPRDLNGNYTLAPGNPVVSGTIIESVWANNTMNDIAQALSDSLSRSGLGGMLSPFYNSDGTMAAPGISWANEQSSGWYRKAAGVFWYSVAGADVVGISSAGVTLGAGKTIANLLAVNVVNSPSGGISATNVQAALNELDADKVPLNGTGATGTWGISITGNAATADFATTAGTAGSVTNGVTHAAGSTDGYVPQWDGTSGKVLKAGVPIQASVYASNVANALLKVGSFGLGGFGASSVLADANQGLATGFYSYAPSTVGVPPMGGWGTILHHALDGTGDDWVQIAAHVTGGTAGFAWRSCITGAIGAWAQLLPTTGQAASAAVAVYSQKVPDNGSQVISAASAGKALWLSGDVTINSGIMSAQDAVTLVNGTATPINILQGTAQVRRSFDGTIGSAILGPYGIATLWYASDSVAYLSGAGVS